MNSKVKVGFNDVAINQSINQSINVFQGKIQTVQFRNIYKHVRFLLDIHMKLVIMKTNYLTSCEKVILRAVVGL